MFSLSIISDVSNNGSLTKFPLFEWLKFSPSVSHSPNYKLKMLPLRSNIFSWWLWRIYSDVTLSLQSCVRFTVLRTLYFGNWHLIGLFGQWSDNEVLNVHFVRHKKNKQRFLSSSSWKNMKRKTTFTMPVCFEKSLFQDISVQLTSVELEPNQNLVLKLFDFLVVFGSNFLRISKEMVRKNAAAILFNFVVLQIVNDQRNRNLVWVRNKILFVGFVEFHNRSPGHFFSNHLGI